MVNWLNENSIEFAHKDEINKIIKTPNLQSKFTIKNDSISQRNWGKNSSSIYGAFINFRGLQHAPVNEQGVVLLFGMICLQLGYIIEVIQTGFPDCEAKRRIDKSKNQ